MMRITLIHYFRIYVPASLAALHKMAKSECFSIALTRYLTLFQLASIFVNLFLQIGHVFSV